jgi:hypothetical protein
MERVIAADTTAVGAGDAPPGSGTPGEFTSGTPGVTPATVFPGWWITLVQRELVNIVLAGGLALDQTKSSQLFQGLLAAASMTDTGSANAMVVTPPVAVVLNAGMRVIVKVAATNTSTAVTLNASGTGVIAVKKADGVTNPAVGDLLAGVYHEIIYDGTIWRAKNLPSDFPEPFVGPLNLSGTSAGSVKTAAFTMDQAVAIVSLGGKSYNGISLSLSFDGATSGANGMAGAQSFPAAAQLDVYAIYNPTTSTWATLGNASGAVGAKVCPVAMPSGYTASILLGSYVTTSSFFRNFIQYGNVVSTAMITLASGLAATSWTSINCAVYLPVNAKSVGGEGGIGGAATALEVAANSTGLGQQFAANGAISTGASFFVPISVPQTIYYQNSGGGATNTIQFSSYTF